MGEQQEHKAEPGAAEAEEPKAGWFTRWRERRRENSARAADISRRTWEVERQNREKAAKYGDY